MKDNFSKQAGVYAKYRPSYPKDLFDFILAHIKNKQTAWDCGTGNGQTAKELATHFKKVFATDISQKQIDNAHETTNIFYSLQPAEQTNFPDNTFDLITVSQALHWFQFDKFYNETKRVAKPGALIAVWTYTLITISPEIDKIITDFDKNTLGQYWDKERKYMEECYATIPFPFNEIKTPVFKIRFEWTLNELEGFLNTWSALQNYMAINHTNPVEDVIKKIRSNFIKEKMPVAFPVYLRMGQIEK